MLGPALLCAAKGSDAVIQSEGRRTSLSKVEAHRHDGVLQPEQQPASVRRMHRQLQLVAASTVALAGCSQARLRQRLKRGRPARIGRSRCLSYSSDSPAIPDNPTAFLEARRSRRWEQLRESLDWTRYHLSVAVVEASGEADVRLAAGLFERIARFNGCAGALPVQAVTCITDGDVQGLQPELMESLSLGRHWMESDVEVFDETSLNFYDVLVCLDAGAAEVVEGVLARAQITPRPPKVIDLGDYGAYLQYRRPESPMKAWVPDWREVVDPKYDERQAAAKPPCDGALAVWRCIPEDLARLVQPRYESLAAGLSASNQAVQLCSGEIDDDSLAHISFHMGGLVRLLMDSYPLDLHGGPGYDGPP